MTDPRATQRICAVLVGTVALLLTPASAAVAEPCTWHGVTCSGGTTSTGTVTDKGWDPPRERVHMIGKRAHVDHLAECWRLDVRWGPFSGWTCVDRATWDRTQVGDPV